MKKFYGDGIMYCGDCLDWLAKKVESESVDLVYIDPPFFSQRDYKKFTDKWVSSDACAIMHDRFKRQQDDFKVC